MSGSREIGVFPRVQFFIQTQFFFTYYSCAAFNWGLWVLSVTKKKLRIAGFFASLPFLTYLWNKRLKPSIHCVQLQRKIAQIVRMSSKQNDRSIDGMFVFCNPCARAKTVFSHLKDKSPGTEEKLKNNGNH